MFVALPGTFQTLLNAVCVVVGGCVTLVSRAIFDGRLERLNDRHGDGSGCAYPPDIIVTELAGVLQAFDEVRQIRQCFQRVITGVGFGRLSMFQRPCLGKGDKDAMPASLNHGKKV